MIILTIRTDNPLAEIGLFDDTAKIDYEKWEGHKQLSRTIHQKIDALLKKNDKDWHSIEGIVCFKGPGSFTGLRIGLTIANTLATDLSANIAGTSGSDWINDGIDQLLNNENEKIVMPDYGSDPHITKQKR